MVEVPMWIVVALFSTGNGAVKLDDYSLNSSATTRAECEFIITKLHEMSEGVIRYLCIPGSVRYEP